VSALLDTSIVLASLDADEPHHAACDRVLAAGGHTLYVHALTEVFSVLTGGRTGRRLRPAVAATLLRESVLPYVRMVALDGKEAMAALVDCEARGVRGGAIYDFLHLAAARKAGVERLLTLDVSHFQALSRPGDPRIETP